MDEYNIDLPDYINDAMSFFILTEEELIKMIYQKPDWFSHIDDHFRYRDFTMPENNQESLDLWIEWYSDKKSKHVNEAGRKLRKVFLELPPLEQRKVGMALLTGGKTDTEWVCSRLDNHKPSWKKDWVINWHPCYSELVEKAWNKYHGKCCGKLLIQFLDKDIVRSHYDELVQDDELYFAMCRRFVKEPWFSVDSERLANITSINAYLFIMSQTTEGIGEKEAEQLLYQWIATIAAKLKVESILFNYEKVFWQYKKEEHRVIYAWGMSTALYYLLKMNMLTVVTNFLKWDQYIYSKYHLRLDAEKDCPENQGIFVDVILENLPDAYKHLSCIDEEHYQYAYRVAQPFTRPRKIPHYGEDDIYPENELLYGEADESWI